MHLSVKNITFFLNTVYKAISVDVTGVWKVVKRYRSQLISQKPPSLVIKASR